MHTAGIYQSNQRRDDKIVAKDGYGITPPLEMVPSLRIPPPACIRHRGVVLTILEDMVRVMLYSCMRILHTEVLKTTSNPTKQFNVKHIPPRHFQFAIRGDGERRTQVEDGDTLVVSPLINSPLRADRSI